YLETAERLKEQQGKDIEKKVTELEQLDFEFVLFSSAIIDYDYIMSLLSQYTQPSDSKKEKMTKKELVELIASTSNLMDDRKDIEEYIEELDQYVQSLDGNKGLSEKEVMEGYQKFKAEKSTKQLATVAEKHGIDAQALQAFVDAIMARKIFDGEKLIDLLEPLNLGWRDRTKKELELMEDLIPLLKKLANGREIMGLKAYE
ncbi:MAG: type I restriction endonuclease subunit R, partial [Oscillospiraceae bacterium]